MVNEPSVLEPLKFYCIWNLDGKFSFRRRKHNLVMFYKMINGLCPDYLTEMVPEQVNQISFYNLRNSDDYFTIRTNSQLYFNSCLPSVVREWNVLPQACRDAISSESFKRSLNIEPTRKPSYHNKFYR